MIDIYDQIIENLELERDLGTRTVEIDRALLVPPKPSDASAPASPSESALAPSGAAPAPAAEATAPSIASNSPVAGTPVSSSAACDMLFLSGRPLSAAGQEAMRKTFAAMKKIKADVTVRLNENVPARIIVLLGSDALKGRSAVAARPVRGRWMAVDGVPALPTFSPDYIFSHFQDGSPGMAAAKRDMWNDIKAALARL